MSNAAIDDVPAVMGILNATPDSFSDGGAFLSPEDAVRHGLELLAQGADILDVGGESTRPGSAPVSVEQECERVVPVLAQLHARAPSAQLSIDTTKPEVARRAVRAGATMINDVSMLRHGPQLAELAAEAEIELVLMHSRKKPADMQEGITYTDVVAEVCEELAAAARTAEKAGVTRARIWLDPGIGFAKDAFHNAALLANIPALVALGYRVLVGPSRKSFIGAFTGAPVSDRLGGTAAAVTAAVLGGAAAIRVHDVATMRQAALVAAAIRNSGRPRS